MWTISNDASSRVRVAMPGMFTTVVVMTWPATRYRFILDDEEDVAHADEARNKRTGQMAEDAKRVGLWWETPAVSKLYKIDTAVYNQCTL